ncbi:hypothetical protein [Nannocystis pusilla]|uniref:hypothetical protein n=1 Tax=Nannocystis pusilla TaxID=889268 RepID=UPI003B811640
MDLVLAQLYPRPTSVSRPRRRRHLRQPGGGGGGRGGPARGHYCAGGRRYYVDSARRVTLICGPDGPCFTRVGELPEDAKADRHAVADSVLWALATVAETELEVQP